MAVVMFLRQREENLLHRKDRVFGRRAVELGELYSVETFLGALTFGVRL
ncbi:MAG: hypothetical protein ACE5IJ_11840 [Thermoplasmata archaeon]